MLMDSIPLCIKGGWLKGGSPMPWVPTPETQHVPSHRTKASGAAATRLEIPLASRKRAETLITDNDIMNTKLKPKTMLPQATILSASPESWAASGPAGSSVGDFN